MKVSLRCCGILSHEIDMVWEHVKPMIAKAIQYADGKFTINQIKDFISNQKMQLWVAASQTNEIQACCVTQIVCYPNKKIMLIVFASGTNSKEWLHLIKDLQAFAQYHECNAIELFGRKGWERKLKSRGYEVIHTVLRLTLPGANYEKNMD